MRLCFFFLLLFHILPLQAAEAPEKAVKRALDEVTQGRIGPGNLSPLQISPHTLKSKKKEIGEQWQALGKSISRQGRSPELERTKVSGDLAAVSVALRGPVGPEELRLLVFGVCRVDGTWKVAPVMGSFANTGLGFDETTLEERREMENWIARERGRGLARATEKAEKSFQAELMAALPDAERKKATPREVVQRFLAACRAGRAKEMLRWLGYPEDLNGAEQKRLTRVISKGLRGLDAQNTWAYLCSDNTLSMTLGMKIEDDRGHVVVGFYNPLTESGQRWQVHRFFLEKKAGGHWRLRLPGIYSHADAEGSEFWRSRNSDTERNDRTLLPHMAAILADEGEKKRAATPEEAVAALTAVLHAEKFARLAPYFVWDAEAPPRDRRIALERAGNFWTRHMRMAGAVAEPVALLREGQEALAVLRISDEKRYPEIELIGLPLRKDDAGWGMALHPRENADTDANVLLKRFQNQEAKLKNKILHEKFGRLFTRYDGDRGEITEAKARGFLSKYFSALESGEMARILPLCAVGGANGDFSAHLEKVHNDILGGLAVAKAEDTEISLGDGWAAASVSSKSGLYQQSGYSVLLIVPTKAGPRLLLDADLWVETSKAKELRNAASMKTLQEKLKPGKWAAVKKLVATQQKKMREVIAEKDRAAAEADEKR